MGGISIGMLCWFLLAVFEYGLSSLLGGGVVERMWLVGVGGDFWHTVGS